LFPLRTRVSTCIYITSTDFFIAQILRSSRSFRAMWREYCPIKLPCQHPKTGGCANFDHRFAPRVQRIGVYLPSAAIC
ncbi:MAG: hypothetical protein JW941_13060, partial [Candidatus Coatesbacteria bacterium]|nr:hypothetical protein [Candidatus Coatesbacteria bacterium]